MRSALRRQWLRVTAAALIGVLVFAAVYGARSLGMLQELELRCYDLLLSHNPPDRCGEDWITVVLVGEEDIRRLGHYPIQDGELAKLLEQRLLPLGPRAIGVDIFRDIEAPPGHEDLQRVLADHDNIIAITKFGEGEAKVPPPPVLKDSDRIGFCDHIIDSDGRVRRGLLYLDDGDTPLPSLALRLALIFLQARGIEPQPDPVHPEHLRLGRTTLRPLEPTDGAYIDADTRGYQILLDYRGRRDFRTIGFCDVLDGRVRVEDIRDRIVFVGVASSSVKDFLDAPIGRNLAAVKIHAHAADQLLRSAMHGSRPTEVRPDWQEALWMLFWSVFGAGLGLGIRSVWRLILLSAGGVLLLALCAWLAFRFGQWIPLLPPAMAFLGSTVLITAYVLHGERQDRSMLMYLFSRHVSPDVAETIWEQRDQIMRDGRLQGTEIMATVLFTDLQGFTAISESEEPGRLVEWLNEYMQVMSELVIKHSGMVNKYIGDSIMAIFGAPLPPRSQQQIRRDAQNAVRCALAMRRELAQLNAMWRSRQQPEVRMRVGICSGLVVAGSIGGTSRLEYTVIGDTVNTASRIESFEKGLMDEPIAAGGCRILISQSTLDLLDEGFSTQQVAVAALRGQSERIAIHGVVG